MYTPLTKKALAICWDAHRNQTDKGGLPYVFHPLHLAEQMPLPAWKFETILGNLGIPYQAFHFD